MNDSLNISDNHLTTRVCVLSESYLPQSGGTPSQIRTLVAGLRSHGVEAFIITRRVSTDDPLKDDIDGIRVCRIGPVGTGPQKKWGMLPTAVMALFKTRADYDVIYVPGFRVIGMAAVLVAKIWRKKTVFRAVSCGEISGDFFTAGLAGKSVFTRAAFRVIDCFRKYLLRQADSYVAISRPIAAELLSGGISERLISRISNGIDTELYSPPSTENRSALRSEYGFPPDAFLGVYTGRLVRYKGVNTLVKGWKRVVDSAPDAILLLVGEGSNDMHNCEMELRTLVRDMEMSDNVVFVGSVTEVSDYLKLSDCFIFPTEDEAFGISLIEAMACSLPVVSTDVGGIKDFLVDGENGIVIGVGDACGLSAAVLKIKNDVGIARRLAAKARSTVVENYSDRDINAKYAKLFKSLTAR